MAAPAAAAVAAAAPRLAARALDVAVPGRTLVRALELEARGGDFVAVLGNNGVGKTLTLHALAGLRAPSAGAVNLDGRDIADWPGRERARRLALLPQVADDPFPSTVFDTALIGRHPHLPFWQWEGAEDRARARAALAAVGLAEFAPRAVDSLSGGERRRLDVATLHDPTLAARWASHALLLFGDGRWQFGAAPLVLGAASLSALYGVPVEEIAWRGGRVFVSP